MRDVFEPKYEPAEPDPVRRAQAAMARTVLPKRFYAEVTVEQRDGENIAILLDGRPARTPGRNLLALPNVASAEVVAQEWRAQVAVINPATMHATRMVNTAIDSFAGRLTEVQEDAARYAESDLVCYRADEPQGLAALQAAHWDPVVTWAKDGLGAQFMLVEGLMHQAQPQAALKQVKGAAGAINRPVRLAAFHVMTTLTGSCLIALMAAHGAIGADAAWEAATVDEAWNASLWGMDEEAAARLAARRAEFGAAYALCVALT